MEWRRSFGVFAVALMAVGSAWAPCAGQEAAPFSLEQVLGVPFPSDLTPSPSGALVGWIFNERGSRNLWVAEAPRFSGRRVTNWMEDDGQELSLVGFAPDDRFAVLVRGGSANREGESPNPRHEADPPKEDLLLAPLDGSEPRVLASGSRPALSPSGDLVAFARGKEVWTASTADTAHAARLFTIRGRVDQMRFSPDGSRLAFVSRRDDHSFVGIYDRSAGTIRYPDAGVDSDSNPVWSPDGSRLAFIRVPFEGSVLPFMPRRSALPWSIRLIDLAGDSASSLWTADSGPGSAFRNISAANQLLWTADDFLVFPWEKDGWTHLYAIASTGGEARLLTPGAFEVQFASLTHDRQGVLYSSNEADIDRQHVWTVGAARGAPVRLSFGEGIEWAPVGLTDGSVALLASDARTPASPERLVPGQSPHSMAPGTIPAEFPRDRLVVPQPVVFPAADGMEIHGQLFLPPGAEKGDRHPAVLFFHGGSRRQMLLGFHHRRYYHNAYAFNQYLASRGYVVLSVNYRSGIGYGMEFREALDYGARGASEFNDVLGAGLTLRGRSDVDPGRIGLWGGSYGGYLTALGLARASDLFAAGVDLHGVHDWNVVIRNFVPAYEAEQRLEVARLAFQSSPMAYLDTWRSPVLLIHGDDDRNVPFSETVSLVEGLRRRSIRFEQLIFPDEIHDFLQYRHWLMAYRAAAAFFDRELRGDGR